MASGRNAVKRIAALLLRAVPAGFVALALHGIFGLVHWYTWNAYVVIGVSVSVFGWGGNLLSRGTDFPRGTDIESANLHGGGPASGGPVGQQLLRLPFWFMAGGCGYTTGMLTAKKLLLLGFYDTPVRPIFLLGGVMGCALQLIYMLPTFRTIFGDAYDPR